MTYRIVVAAAALEELDHASRWYSERVGGLASQLAAEVDEAIGPLAEWPRAGRRVPRGPKGLEVRQVSLRRFPDRVVYEVADGVVTVLAIAHQRRRPGYWRDRLD